MLTNESKSWIKSLEARCKSVGVKPHHVAARSGAGERSWWNWKSGFCNPSATSRDVIEKYMAVLEKWHLLNGVSFAGYRVSNEE